MSKKILGLRITTLVASVLAVILYATPFIKLSALGLEKTYSGFQLGFDFGALFSKDGGNYVAKGGTSIFAFVSVLFVIFSAIISIVSVVTINKINKAPKAKKINPTLMLVLDIVGGLFPLIINLLTLKATGYGDTSIASLGYGAILSGIIFFIGQIVAGVTNYISDKL